jgi:hypothetical protein
LGGRGRLGLRSRLQGKCRVCFEIRHFYFLDYWRCLDGQLQLYHCDHRHDFHDFQCAFSPYFRILYHIYMRRFCGDAFRTIRLVSTRTRSRQAPTHSENAEVVKFDPCVISCVPRPVPDRHGCDLELLASLELQML